MTSPSPAEPAAPISCTLSADDAVTRVGDWSAVVSRATRRARTDGGVQLTFADDPKLAGELAELAARERQCCPFFTFSLRIAGDGITLDVAVPAEADAVLAALFEPSDDAHVS